MPDSFDVTGFVISIISLMGLHKLGALVASRLPPGRLKAIKADLAEMRELLEHLECERYPNGAASLHHFQNSLQQFNTRAGNLSLEISRWKERGVLRRYAHWVECGELINDCRNLHGDIADLRAHLHKLPPRARHTHTPQAAPSEASSYTAASSCSPAPTTATSFSLTPVSSTVASSSPSLPETPISSLPDPAPTPVKSADPTIPAETIELTEPSPTPDRVRRMRRTSISPDEAFKGYASRSAALPGLFDPPIPPPPSPLKTALPSSPGPAPTPIKAADPATPAEPGPAPTRRTSRARTQPQGPLEGSASRITVMPGRSDRPVLRRRVVRRIALEPE